MKSLQYTYHIDVTKKKVYAWDADVVASEKNLYLRGVSTVSQTTTAIKQRNIIYKNEFTKTKRKIPSSQPKTSTRTSMWSQYSWYVF
jgi:hypothetical protein